ncbi:NUDIX domain-containing protein [Streptomyces gobiensis]|uniref:NUDIX domain-containing protein n=1 Tax=Streptomyces gobiensis TaxID=2875706 RepID=UPI001E5F5438|nr:NUDIX domain-containing protein [Streptomyces gobiensis]UGY91499.1 NUDIX domain-containing protein [Streptomyces gobiensis]
MSATTGSARPAADVHILVIRHGRLLLGLRAGPGYGSGRWAPPCGKLEPGEPLPAAAARELAEETGLSADPPLLRLRHVVHAVRDDGIPDTHLGFFFEAVGCPGTPHVLEPGKCLRWEWHDPARLPDDVLPYSAAGIRGAFRDPGGISLYGWD